MDYGVTVDLPSTWLKYKKGLCDGCVAGCCSLPVEVDKDDLLRMGLASPDEVGGSLKKVARRLEAEGITVSFRAKTGLFILAQASNAACIFLDKKSLCTIYEKRPKVCREFPNIGPRPGYCPCIKKKD